MAAIVGIKLGRCKMIAGTMIVISIDWASSTESSRLDAIRSVDHGKEVSTRAVMV
jgi:hypothetical protein